MNILWIDDEENRCEKSKIIDKSTDHTTTFILIENDVNFEEIIAKALDKVYDIVIIDERFTKVNTKINHGSYLSSIILGNKSKAFIVGITADANVETTNDFVKQPYHIFFEEKEFFENIQNVISLAYDYSILMKTRSISSLFKKVLNINKFTREEDLLSVLPKSIRVDYSSINARKTLFQWICNVLLKRAGFLYDEIWLATFLGIKQESLKKITKFFEPAKYKGLFACNKNYWWVESVKDILYSTNKIFRLPTEEVNSFWERGRLLTGLDESDYSKCFITEEDHPEYVAYLDSSCSKVAQIMYEYTEQHLASDNIKYFEEIRVYNDDLL